MNTNVLGAFLVCRESAKLMRQRHFGRIVNFISVAAPMRLAGQAVYAASKYAVVGLSQVMAGELAEFGITVNVVGPSPIPTDMIRGVPKDKIERLAESMPISRMSTFEDVANVVDFFLRSESGAITGQVIYLNGVTNL
jgi:3-oxoacyl-[acyl-carrier protein] reductase